LADITNAEGTQVQNAVLHGILPKIGQRLIGPWIHQERPSATEWHLWRRANLLWSNPQGYLIQPLGRWLRPIHQHRFAHLAYRNGQKLFIQNAEQLYNICRRKMTQTRGDQWVITTSEVAWEHLTPAAVPIDVTYLGNSVLEMRGTSKVVKPARESIVASFDDFLGTLDPWEYNLLQYTELMADPYTVLEAISHGFRIVSDGSAWYGTLGAFGWAMSNDLGERVAVGMGPARGSVATAFRSEAYGMLSALRIVIRLAEFTGQQTDHDGIFATDSESVLETIMHKDRREGEEKVYSKMKRLDVLVPDWDVLFEIQGTLSSLPFLKLQHVKGHQDRHKPYHQLSLLAQLNVDADDQANKFQRLHGAARPESLLFSRTGVHLRFSEGSITSHYNMALRNKATYEPLMSYIAKRNAWPESVLRSIN
jgi:hypothetical protein